MEKRNREMEKGRGQEGRERTREERYMVEGKDKREGEVHGGGKG